MRKQHGMTFIGLVLIIAAGIFVAIIGIKITPAYIEFSSVKNLIKKIGAEPALADMSPKDIAAEFDKGADIAYVKVVTSKDLVIEKGESGRPVVSVDYQQVVPIIANVSALLDFSASTQSSSKKPLADIP